MGRTHNAMVVSAAMSLAVGQALVADVLLDNGPLVTNPGQGAVGADVSALQVSLGMLNIGFFDLIADDFTISDPDGWTIDTITFFAYQTGSTTTSTITAVNLRIWDGPPTEAGSSIVWGDTRTDVLQNTAWSGAYRTSDGDLQSTLRPIMANVISVGTSLPQGSYWLDWGSAGSLDSGPFAPPISVLGAVATGNGRHSIDGGVTYAPVTDAGTGTGQGFPFIIEGEGQGVACDGDTNGDGTVNVNDLVNVISSWGGDGQGRGFNADLNGDGIVDVTDLVAVITGWGACPTAAPTRACCTGPETCMETTELSCAISGGNIQPAGTTCSDVECIIQTGACCLGAEMCQDLLPSDCLAIGGDHQGGATSCAGGLCDPDPNDLCVDAEALDVSAGPVTVAGQTLHATNDPNAFACPPPNTVDAPGNWYTVVGTGATITASLCVGTDYDAKLHVYCGADCGELSCVAGDDDGCGYTAGPSELQWCSEPGRQYFILVSGWNGATGVYELTLTPEEPCDTPTPCQEPPSNDQCAKALGLYLGGGPVIVTGQTNTATDDPEAFACPPANTVDAPGNWYTMVGTGETITASLCAGTYYDAKLHVYCGTDCGDLTCLTGDDDSCGYMAGPPVVQWCSAPGQSYYLLVSGWNGATGAYQLVVTPGAACGEPTPCQE